MTPRKIVLGFSRGRVSMIHDDDLLAALRQNLRAERVSIVRASHVEARRDGSAWDADMGPVGGPMLTGFPTRKAALTAEVDYLQTNVLCNPAHFAHPSP